MEIKTFAAIDVGSFEVDMKIFELGGIKEDSRTKRGTGAGSHIRQIDHLRQRIALGSDTYTSGKISTEKLDELCRTLREYGQIMKAYKVDDYKIYGTSALRESENALIILDQIRQRTGMSIELLSNSEQRFLGYKSIASKGEVFRRVIEENTAIVDIGGGSIQISLFENDALAVTSNLRLGVLRVQERLNSMNVGSSQREALVDELVMAQLSTFKKLYLKDRTIKNVIIMDDYLSPWAIRKAGNDAEKSVVQLAEYEKLLEKLRVLTVMQAAQMMDVQEEKVPLIFISAVLLHRICELMGAEKIWAPGVSLGDGMAYEYAEKKKLLSGEHDFEKDILACAANISKKYMGSRKRGETLDHIATTIFDSMKKVHGLGKRERLYLRLAALLHDCGKFISLVNIGETSYDIIMATEIIGLSHREREIIANVVRFNHSPFLYYGELQGKGSGLDQNAYLTVAKLTAILRVANSLDRSHKQKLKGVKAVLKENQLILQVDTLEDLALEKGYLKKSGSFFEEVFSVEPLIRQRKQI